MRIHDILDVNHWVKGKLLEPMVTGYYPDAKNQPYMKIYDDRMCLAAAAIRHAAQEAHKYIGPYYVMNGSCSLKEMNSLRLMARIIKELFPERANCPCEICCNSHYLSPGDLQFRFRHQLGWLHTIESFNDDMHTTFDHVEKVISEYQHRIDNQ